MPEIVRETRVYPTCCTSAFCGRIECEGCPHKPALDAFKAWRDRTGGPRRSTPRSGKTASYAVERASEKKMHQALAFIARAWQAPTQVARGGRGETESEMASIIKTDTEHTICAQCACYLNTGDLSFIDYHWNGEDAADMEERIVEFELTLLTPVDGATHCTLDTRGRTDHYGEFDCECCGCGEWGQPVVPIVHHWAPAADAVSL